MAIRYRLHIWTSAEDISRMGILRCGRNGEMVAHIVGSVALGRRIVAGLNAQEKAKARRKGAK